MASAGDKSRASSAARIGASSSGTSSAQRAERPPRWQLARISNKAWYKEDEPFCGRLIWTVIGKPIFGNTATLQGHRSTNTPWYITNINMPADQKGFLPCMVIDARVVELLPIFAQRIERQEYDAWLACTEAETRALGEPHA